VAIDINRWRNMGVGQLRIWERAAFVAVLTIGAVGTGHAQAANTDQQAQASAKDHASGASAAADAEDQPQETVAANLLTTVPDPATVEMPDLKFTETPEIASTYDKYFYFHRADTDFVTALADIRECDDFARGLVSNITYTNVPYPYQGTMAGAIGGAIGDALAYAIFGSAEKRQQRRGNLRRCMHYKGYQRYGLEKGRWQAFNFEEGLSSVKEVDRQRMLAQQAKVAAAPNLVQKDLGL
jgi:hypothetical protein